MYLHCSFMPVPPAIRQPTANPRIFTVIDPKTGVTAASVGRIFSLCQDTMVKKRAYWNTAKERIIL